MGTVQNCNSNRHQITQYAVIEGLNFERLESEPSNFTSYVSSIFSYSFSHFQPERRARCRLSANTIYVASLLCMSYLYSNRQRRPRPLWKILCWEEYVFFRDNDSEASSPRLAVSLPHIIRRPARSFILIIVLSQNMVDKMASLTRLMLLLAHSAPSPCSTVSSDAGDTTKWNPVCSACASDRYHSLATVEH
jgi:hypothetical protein